MKSNLMDSSSSHTAPRAVRVGSVKQVMMGLANLFRAPLGRTRQSVAEPGVVASVAKIVECGPVPVHPMSSVGCLLMPGSENYQYIVEREGKVMAKTGADRAEREAAIAPSSENEHRDDKSRGGRDTRWVHEVLRDLIARSRDAGQSGANSAFAQA